MMLFTAADDVAVIGLRGADGVAMRTIPGRYTATASNAEGDGVRAGVSVVLLDGSTQRAAACAIACGDCPHGQVWPH